MIEFYKRQKSLILFLVAIGGLYGLWYGLYECWIGPNDYVDTWLSGQVAQAGAVVLRLFNYETVVKATTILVNNRPTLYIGNPCNGLALMAVFTGLISAFPGAVKMKLYFIPLGIALIFLINVLRVVILTINHIYSRSTVAFNHHYTFSFLVYAFIFSLWMIWVKKYSKYAVFS